MFSITKSTEKFSDLVLIRVAHSDLALDLR